MAAPIGFHFDFSSPYGYLASAKIDAVASKHGRTLLCRPHLPGVSLKHMPMKADQPERRPDTGGW